jgi:parvulin-like peptidyl-prolyl isomerase
MPDESLPAIHARLAFLETQMGNINQSLQRLADDMHQLAIASAKREQDAETLARAFKRIEAIEQSVMALKEGIEAAERQRLQTEIDNAHAEEQKEEDRKAKVILEIVRTTLIVGASIGLYHFGVRLL